jgi:emfourin
MGTRVQLTRSGGFAGLSMVASVDLDDVPAETAAAVRAALEQVDFDPPRVGAGGGRRIADAYQYDLEVIDEGRRSLTAHEPLADPGLQALSEVLLPLARPE